MNKESKKGFIEIIILALFVLAAFTTIIVLSVQFFKKQRQKCIDNPPSINYVEEDLESVFLTTFVVVEYVDPQEESIIYIVYANGLYYKVLYIIENGYIFSFYWEYKKHVQISKEELSNWDIEVRE